MEEENWNRRKEANMGSIYKRGKIWWIKYYRAGKGYRESSGSKKESDAKRLSEAP